MQDVLVALKKDQAHEFIDLKNPEIKKIHWCFGDLVYTITVSVHYASDLKGYASSTVTQTSRVLSNFSSRDLTRRVVIIAVQRFDNVKIEARPSYLDKPRDNEPYAISADSANLLKHRIKIKLDEFEVAMFEETGKPYDELPLDTLLYLIGRTYATACFSKLGQGPQVFHVFAEEDPTTNLAFALPDKEEVLLLAVWTE